MADVQIDNGDFTRIANAILENIAKAKLNGTQRSIIDILWRYTYGFQRGSAKMSLSFISKATDLDKHQIQRELIKLIDRKIILVEKESTYTAPQILKFNKDFEQWSIQLAKTLTVSETAKSTVSELAHSTVSELANQERNIKDNTKESMYTIFNHWNNKKLIRHRKLTKVMESSIHARLIDKYELSTILEAIDNFETVVNGNEYYWTHKFTLTEFMNPRNIDRFLTENNPFDNFRKDKKKGGQAIETSERDSGNDEFAGMFNPGLLGSGTGTQSN